MIEINWDELDPKWQWVARDKKWGLILATAKPYLRYNSWWLRNGEIKFIYTDSNWKDSLQERPTK